MSDNDLNIRENEATTAQPEPGLPFNSGTAQLQLVPELQPELTPGSQPDFESQPQPQSQLQPGLEPQPQPQLQQVPQQGVEPQSQPQPELQQGVDPQPELQQGFEPQPQQEPQSELQPEPSHVIAALPNIPTERVKRANRIRIWLILLLVLLLAALGGLAYLGYTFLFSGSQDASSSVSGLNATKLDGSGIQDNSSVAAPEPITTTIPNLKQLFGLNVDQVKELLSNEFALNKVEPTTDDTNPEIHSLATFSFTPPSQPGAGSATPGAVTSPSSAASQVESLYLSLNADAKVIGVYYMASLDLLGYELTDFATLVGKSEAVTSVLAQAGIAPIADWKYQLPTPEEYTQYVDPKAEPKKVKKLTTSFYAATDLGDNLPKSWNLTFTYDYGASGVVLGTDTLPTQRMLYLKLY